MAGCCLQRLPPEPTGSCPAGSPCLRGSGCWKALSASLPPLTSSNRRPLQAQRPHQHRPGNFSSSCPVASPPAGADCQPPPVSPIDSCLATQTKERRLHQQQPPPAPAPAASCQQAAAGALKAAAPAPAAVSVSPAASACPHCQQPSTASQTPPLPKRNCRAPHQQQPAIPQQPAPPPPHTSHGPRSESSRPPPGSSPTPPAASQPHITTQPPPSSQ